MFEELKNFVSLFGLEFLPEERLRPSPSVRLHLAIGGLICLVLGAMTSFNEGLALIDTYQGHLGHLPMVFGVGLIVYSLLLVCPAGILSLIASTGRRGRRVALLSHWAAIMGLLGSFFFNLEEFLSGGSGILEMCLMPGLGFSMILLGICLMLAYPISMGVLPPASIVPLLVTPLLMFTIYPEPPMIVEPLTTLYRLYNSLLYLILPALTLAIPIGIRFMALPGRSTKA